MNIAGWHKCSFVDYPGQIAVTLFTPGCNMRCSYCHNRATLVDRALHHVIPLETVFSFLRKRRGLINAVVITGGEPTMQKGLEEFLSQLREMGFLLKLDTNGSNPGKLAAILNAELVNYVALDIKAPPEKLPGIINVPLDPELIEQSKRLIALSGVDYEFRTTVIPQLTFEDMLAIGSSISGAKRYALQQYKKPRILPDCQDPAASRPAHAPAFFLRLQHAMQDWFEELILRDVDLTQRTKPTSPTTEAARSRRYARAVGE